MLCRISTLLIFASISISGFCQNFSTSIIKFDENDGFKAENYIGDIKSDSEGNIWIIDFNQVNRYDGIQFKTIEPGKVNHNALLRFIEGGNGRKLVFDYTGMLYYLEGDTLIPSEYNQQLSTVKTSSNFTDIKIDKEGRLHISYDKSGYLIVDRESIIKPLEGLPKK